ncbi:MAG TPA: N-6 DNA methylase, partial [Pyrinomonadaceae bacterium]
IVLSNRILSGDSNAHLEVKRRLLDECDLHAVVILPKGMFEPYTPNPTCFFIFQKTGQPTRSVWFYHVEGDGSSLKKARKFGSQFRNDFPDLLKKWRTRETQEGRAWLVPAEKIIATNYDMTPIGLGLIGPEEVEHAEPTSILAAVSGREKRAGELIDEIRSEVESERPQPDQGWDEATVKELCGKPQYGYTESATVERVGPRFLRITDIQNGEVKWDDVPYCRCEEVAKYRLADGDIVFARTGATTGKSYLVRNPPEAIFASYLIRIRPGGRVLPDYMWWYFQSSGYWASVFSGTDDGNRPNMNGSKLADLRIPFPVSKDEQWLIIARLDALAVKLAELRRLQTDTEAALATFTPAVLAKAFRGEL